MLFSGGINGCYLNCIGLAVWFFVGHMDSPSAAELYRWIDRDGVVHFSDQAPAPAAGNGKPVQVLEIPDPPAPPAAAAMQPDGEYVVPFQRAYGGMLVNVLFNDRVPAKMIVDTGATTVKINVSLLRKLNQDLPVNLKKRKARTAAGVIDMLEIVIEKIDLGGAVKRDVRASFTDEAYDYPHYDGLLGLSFLSDFKMTIDYEHNLIHLVR